MSEEVRSEIVGLTKEMIKRKTVQGREDELEACIDFIEGYFAGEDFTVNKFDVGGKPSLVISLDSSKKSEILLHGHIDVVAGKESQFRPTEKDGRLYGRGAADMKGGVACLMKVMKDLGREDNPPSATLMIVSDEEIGGFKGAHYLLNEVGYSSEFAISAEPNIEIPMGITVSQKGVLKIKLIGKGKAAHASRPWKGENAIEKLMRDYLKVKELFEERQDGEWRTTVTPSTIRGGDSNNKVADKAALHLDIRYTEQLTAHNIVQQLEEMDDIDFEVVVHAPMLQNDRDNPYIQHLKESAEQYGDPEFSRKTAASDMRHLTKKDIPAVVFGPYGEAAHGDRECLHLNSIIPYYNTMIDFLTGL